MHVLQAFQHLVNDVLLVNVLEDIGPNNSMQISVHEVKDEVNISVVLSSDYVLQSDNVFMSRQLLQEDDLSESPLCISCVLERVEVLFESHDVLCLLVDGFPDDTIGSLTYNVL